MPRAGLHLFAAGTRCGRPCARCCHLPLLHSALGANSAGGRSQLSWLQLSSAGGCLPGGSRQALLLLLRAMREGGALVVEFSLATSCIAASYPPACLQRVELGVLDAAGSGALSPSQLRAWLERRAPLAACCEALVSEGDWCTTVAARLLLLHGRRGRVLIRDLAASPEALELAMALHAWDAAAAAAQAAAAAAEAGEGDPAVGATSPAAQLAMAMAGQQGWFGPAAVAALRARFAELDGDGDGLLTEEDFSW